MFYSLIHMPSISRREQFGAIGKISCRIDKDVPQHLRYVSILHRVLTLILAQLLNDRFNVFLIVVRYFQK